MSTYSTTLRIELIGAGEQDGTWGDTTNSNLGDLIEAAITDKVDITFANATYTLSANNGLPDEARNAVLNLIGTNVTAQNLIAPAVQKTYIIKNATGAAVTIKTSSGTGVAVATGTTVQVWCDGTEFYASTIPTGATTGTGNVVFSASPTLTGVPVAPTANAGANTTQIATTAFVTSAVTTATGSLGTMSTQNASAVTITGGSITGITDLAIADGGTGASTAANARTNLGLGSLATLNTVGTSQIDNASITPAKLNGAQSGSPPIYGVRAWGRLNNTTIVAGGNIASASFSGSEYTVTFTTAMPDADYSVVGTHNNSNGDSFFRPFTITSISSGSFSFSVSAGAQSSIICFQVIR
jgi:hypothetical protein